MHYMFNRVGGLKEELPAGWTGRARHAVDEVRRRLPDLDDLVRGNEIFRARTRGVGVLSPPSWCTRTASAGRSPGPPASTSTCAATSPTWRTASCDVPGRDPDRRATASPGSRCCSTRCTSRSTWPTPAWTGSPACRRAGQRPAAQGAQGAGGRDVRLDREPARASTATTWCPAARRRRGG